MFPDDQRSAQYMERRLLVIGRVEKEQLRRRTGFRIARAELVCDCCGQFLFQFLRPVLVHEVGKVFSGAIKVQVEANSDIVGNVLVKVAQPRHGNAENFALKVVP